MAINTIELVKNKNYGFQLTAPNQYVDILTLDLLSGDCTSAYFDAPELAQFKRAALELFTIVAPGERAAGALNLLNRLVAVAPADDVVIVRSANVVSNAATLRITVDANPGSFVAHVPFSGDGAMAWAGGNDSGGGGGGVSAVSATFPITSSGGAAPDIGITLNTAKGITSSAGTGVEVKLDPVTMVFDGGGSVSLVNTLVVPGTYGDATNIPQIDVDSYGRVTNAVNIPISIPPGGVTDVTASSPLSSSGGATPDISLDPGSLSGDVLTWNGVSWIASPVPSGVGVSLLNNVYVAQNGSDVTGDGTLSKPFATVGAAMASITAADSNNRFVIMVAAGEYSEDSPLLIKPNVFVMGENWENTNLFATVALDPTFNTAIDPFSGLSNIAISGTTTVDMALVGNNTARFNAVYTRFNDDVTITAASDSNIFGIVRCVTGGDVIANFNGGDFFSFGTLYQGEINVGESVAAKTFFTSTNDTFNGPFYATNGGGTAAGDFIVVMLGSSLGYEAGNPNNQMPATFTGDVILRTTSNFVPDAAHLILTGGATMEQWSFATGVGYEPAAPGNWLVAPSQVSAALDELASRAAGAGTVTDVTASAPLASSGGATPDISLSPSGVVAGTYGDSATIPVFDVTAEGLITSVTDTAIDFPVTAVTASGVLSSSGGATPDISLSGIVDVVNGGTGASSFNANGVVIVNGPADKLVDVVGTLSGEVLTWNGATWIAAAIPAGGVASVTASAPLASSGGSNPDISLSPSGVTAGAYGNAAAVPESLMPQFSVDVSGLVTVASEAAIQIGGSAAKLYVDTQDGATLASANAYAESLAFGISSKSPVHVATTAALPAYTVDGTFQILTATVNGAFPLIDGETVTSPQRVLVKDEAAGNEPNNGIYVLTQVGDAGNPWILTRSNDANTAAELCGALVPVQTGVTNAGTIWLFAANATTFTLGVDDVVWTSLAVEAATVSTLGTVQLAGGLGGTGTTAFAPKLDVDSVTSGTLPVAFGGTGLNAVATGDLLVASAPNTLSALAGGAAGTVLKGQGAGVAPAFGSVNLAADVSGTLPVANGGTGQTTAPLGSLLVGDGTGYAQLVGTAGTGISITPGVGTLTIANTGVTSVAASSPLASSGGATPTISLNNSGVTAATYGSATSVPVVTVDAKGLVTNVVDTAITFPAAVTSVTASSPLASSGGATPDISLNAGSSSGDVLTWNGTAWVSAAVPTGGLVNWTENTTTYSGKVINNFTVLNAATNVDAALIAKGNGATVAQIANGSASGGDNRGQYATDWQKYRGSSSQVASGNYSTVSGGQYNTASANHATVVGGYINTASGDNSIAGGVNNQATSDGAVALGRQNSAGSGAAIGYGNRTTSGGLLALGYLSEAIANQSVAIGSSARATGDNTTAVSAGGGTASGNWTSLFGGFGNNTSGTGGVTVGGQNNTTSGYWAGVFSGYGNVAPSAYEVGLGYNNYNFGGSSSSYVSTDVALGYGNGGTGNAFTFLKNGWLALGRGTAKPKDQLDVAGNARMTGAIVQDGFTSGAAINAGQVCYLAADGKVYPAQANSATSSSVVGIAVETVGAANQNIALATFNKTSGFSGLTIGTEYFLSATSAGAVVDYTTLSATSGAQIVSLGYARSVTEIQINIQRRGVTP